MYQGDQIEPKYWVIIIFGECLKLRNIDFGATFSTIYKSNVFVFDKSNLAYV
jgi:hypothetical protein